VPELGLKLTWKRNCIQGRPVLRGLGCSRVAALERLLNSLVLTLHTGHLSCS
jgi:hypothetical protein